MALFSYIVDRQVDREGEKERDLSPGQQSCNSRVFFGQLIANISFDATIANTVTINFDNSIFNKKIYSGASFVIGSSCNVLVTIERVHSSKTGIPIIEFRVAWESLKFVIIYL